MIAAAELARLALFDSVEPGALAHLAEALEAREVAAGDVLMHQGAVDQTFVIVLDGSMEVVRGDGDVERRLAVCGPGSILGELSLLRQQPRVASVASLTSGRVGIGSAAAFDELLAIAGVHERIADITAMRLAELAEPVIIDLPKAGRVEVRPLLRSDRHQYVGEVRGLLPESRRRRFFTAGQPSERMIDYLVNIDYIDHFAWVVGTAEHAGLATARYVRDSDEPQSADVAFGVVDPAHGQGLGTFLLGALGAAATEAGITTFTADVLDDNIAMRRVFDKASARWRRLDPGVVHATMSVEATRPLITDEQWTALSRVAGVVVTAAGAALAHPAAIDDPNDGGDQPAGSSEK